MRRHRGGSEVKAGFYWNVAKWSITPVGRGERLPGGPEHTYVRLPAPLLLVCAPLMGGAYVLFLPFIGFVLVLGFAGKKALHGLERAFAGMMSMVSPAWQPGEAYFAGKKREATTEKAPEGGEKLSALEKEIEERRKAGE